MDVEDKDTRWFITKNVMLGLNNATLDDLDVELINNGLNFTNEFMDYKSNIITAIFILGVTQMMSIIDGAKGELESCGIKFDNSKLTKNSDLCSVAVNLCNKYLEEISSKFVEWSENFTVEIMKDKNRLSD